MGRLSWTDKIVNFLGRKKKPVQDRRPEDRKDRNALLATLKEQYDNKEISQLQYERYTEAVEQRMSMREIELAINKLQAGFGAVGTFAAIAGTIGAIAAGGDDNQANANAQAGEKSEDEQEHSEEAGAVGYDD